MVRTNCQKCRKAFFTKPYWLSIGYGKFCSRECQYAARKTGVSVACDTCGKETYKPQKQLKKSKSKKFFCGKVCQTIWRNQLYVGSKHANWKGGEDIDYRQLLVKNRIPQICMLCDSKDKRVLCVHHKDRNRRNNTLDNLVWVCYNCHHLVHAHGVKI